MGLVDICAKVAEIVFVDLEQHLLVFNRNFRLSKIAQAYSLTLILQFIKINNLRCEWRINFLL